MISSELRCQLDELGQNEAALTLTKYDPFALVRYRTHFVAPDISWGFTGVALTSSGLLKHLQVSDEQSRGGVHDD